MHRAAPPAGSAPNVSAGAHVQAARREPATLALLPGTGTPEPGGIDWPIFESLLAVIPWSRVVACDIVELAPALDPSDCSAILAAKIVREIVLALAHSK
ncbi:MAG: arginase family protein [Akkermansiaceae bacterium]